MWKLYRLYVCQHHLLSGEKSHRAVPITYLNMFSKQFWYILYSLQHKILQIQIQVFRLAGCLCTCENDAKWMLRTLFCYKDSKLQGTNTVNKTEGGSPRWLTFFSVILSMICAVTECPTWADNKAAALLSDWTQAVRICCHQGETDWVSHESSIATVGKGKSRKLNLGHWVLKLVKQQPTLKAALN